MRLLFDGQCIQSTSAFRGIGRYSLSLLRALVQEAGDSQVEALLNGGGDSALLLRARAALETFLPASSIHVFDADWPWRYPASDSRRQGAEACNAAAVASLRPDAVLVGSVFEGDGENVLSVNKWQHYPPTAAILYDLIPAADPETYLLGPDADVYWRRFEHLRRADLLLSISNYSAAQARRLVADCPPIATVWGGPYPSGEFPEFEPQTDELPDLELPPCFLLAVGGDHPRKNLDRLVQAWSQVPRRDRNRAPLVIVCALNPGTVRRLRRLARRNGLPPEEFILAGRVSERRLHELYERALAFVFPSTEEGLGMPPLEAMAVGCPTMLARSSSLVELADDEEVFFNGHSIEDMSRALQRLVSDAGFRDRLLRAADASRQRLTWAQTARRAWQALQGLPDAERPLVSAPEPVRGAGVAELTALPAPVLLDDVDLDVLPVLAGTAGEKAAYAVAGGLPAVRAALAPATALCVRHEALSHLVASAGIVEHPMVPPEQLNRVAQHDFYAALRRRLTTTQLKPAEQIALVEAVERPPRWMLHRPRPVWLLLTRNHSGSAVDALRHVCTDLGVDLVSAEPAGWGLARSADLVAVEASVLPDVELASARSHGAVVVALHPPGQLSLTPSWCFDAELLGDSGSPEAWRGLAQSWLARWPRTTGWPWQTAADT